MAYSGPVSRRIRKVSVRRGRSDGGREVKPSSLEFSVVQQIDRGLSGGALNAALPEGADIVAVVEGHRPARRPVRASRWRMEWPFDVTEAIAAFAAADSVEVERITKAGRRILDVRALCSAIEMPAASGRGSWRWHAEPTPRPARSWWLSGPSSRICRTGHPAGPGVPVDGGGLAVPF